MTEKCLKRQVNKNTAQVEVDISGCIVLTNMCSNLSRSSAAEHQMQINDKISAEEENMPKEKRLFAQLPITAACLICNYIFTQQRGVAAINSTHLFMKSSRLKSTVPPGRCLQCCQQHCAHCLNLP